MEIPEASYIRLLKDVKSLWSSFINFSSYLFFPGRWMQ
jgi:hypothetical protein